MVVLGSYCYRRAGVKTIVTMEMVFIALLSFLLSIAIWKLLSLLFYGMLLYNYAMKLALGSLTSRQCGDERGLSGSLTTFNYKSTRLRTLSFSST